MNEAVLRNLVDFEPGYDWKRWGDLWHFAKHCMFPTGDLLGLFSPDDYLRLAQDLGRAAAESAPGIFVKMRGNGDVAVYAESWNGPRGVFMAVRSYGFYGRVITLFSPEQGREYFDQDDPMLI